MADTTKRSRNELRRAICIALMRKAFISSAMLAALVGAAMSIFTYLVVDRIDLDIKSKGLDIEQQRQISEKQHVAFEEAQAKFKIQLETMAQENANFDTKLHKLEVLTSLDAEKYNRFQQIMGIISELKQGDVSITEEKAMLGLMMQLPPDLALVTFEVIRSEPTAKTGFFSDTTGGPAFIGFLQSCLRNCADRKPSERGTPKFGFASAEISTFLESYFVGTFRNYCERIIQGPPEDIVYNR